MLNNPHKENDLTITSRTLFRAAAVAAAMAGLIFIGVQITFLSMFAAGLAGMQRRVSAYSKALTDSNIVSTVGGLILMAGMLVELYLVIACWTKGERASSNPWHSKTLEWQVPTPVPLENFEVTPVVTSDPYGYGEDTNDVSTIAKEASDQ